MIELIFIALILSSLAKILMNFKNKLFVLINLELTFMLITMLLMMKGGSSSIMTPLMIAVFMVLDSALGISLLISNMRSATKMTMSMMKEL